MSYRAHCLLLVISLLLAISACTSRYRLDLLMALGGESRKVKIEATRYIREARLGNPHADRKVLPGEELVVVVRTSARGATLPHSPLTKAMQFDEYLRSDLYLQLPDPVGPGSQPLVGHSFVQVLGRFEQSAEEKVFVPADDGELAIDSVTSKYVYATIHGRYENRAGQTLTMTGGFRVEQP